MENTYSGSRAIILAGGEGSRLQVLTDKMPGGPRPKQFCPLLGPEPLLTQTRSRVARLIPPERIAVVVTRAHERFYAPLLADVAPRSILVQPANRGTAPAILYALMQLAGQSYDGSVALFPSDHYVSDDPIFMSHVQTAFDAVEIRQQAIVLLGSEATAPETGYGWIEPGGRIGASPLFRVQRFWEKPTPQRAETLWERGCLWNTFVLVSRVSTLLSLIAAALPALHRAFIISDALESSQDYEAIERLYAQIDPINFSDSVLALAAHSLAVLPLRGVEWSDIGETHRVAAVLNRAKHGCAGARISTIARQRNLVASRVAGQRSEILGNGK